MLVARGPAWYWTLRWEAQWGWAVASAFSSVNILHAAWTQLGFIMVRGKGPELTGLAALRFSRGRSLASNPQIKFIVLLKTYYVPGTGYKDERD